MVRKSWLLALPPAALLGVRAYKRLTDVLPGRPDLSGKRILITGATAGLGLETAKVLAQLGAHVVMTARDVVKGQEALQAVQAKAPRGSAEILHLDLDSEDSIRSFAQTLLDRGKPIHRLVLNAAAVLVPTPRTWGGRETRVGVNHFSHCLLTWLLLPLLPPGEARIVTVSSGAVDMVDVLAETGNLKNLSLADAEYTPFKHYSLSKAYNLMWGVELQNRLEGKVACFVTQPGMADTDIPNKADPTHPSQNRLLKAITWLFIMQPAAAGALSQTWAAAAPVDELQKLGATIGPNLFNLNNTAPWKPQNPVMRQDEKAQKQRAGFFDATQSELGLLGDWAARVGSGLQNPSKL